MSTTSSFEWNRYRLSLQQALLTFPHFLKNPAEGMRHLPDWDWPTLLTLQGAFAAVCIIIGDIVERHFLSAILSLVTAPIVAVVANLIFSGFFYYTFMFFFSRNLEFRKIFTHLLFASVPILLVSILSGFVPLIGLVGLGAAAILLIIGFSYNFDLPVLKVRNLIIAMFLVYSAMMVAQLLTGHASKEKLKLRATPESLDILEKELKEDSN